MPAGTDPPFFDGVKIRKYLACVKQGRLNLSTYLYFILWHVRCVGKSVLGGKHTFKAGLGSCAGSEADPECPLYRRLQCRMDPGRYSRMHILCPGSGYEGFIYEK